MPAKDIELKQVAVTSDLEKNTADIDKIVIESKEEVKVEKQDSMSRLENLRIKRGLSVIVDPEGLSKKKTEHIY